MQDDYYLRVLDTESPYVSCYSEDEYTVYCINGIENLTITGEDAMFYMGAGDYLCSEIVGTLQCKCWIYSPDRSGENSRTDITVRELRGHQTGSGRIDGKERSCIKIKAL